MPLETFTSDTVSCCLVLSARGQDTPSVTVLQWASGSSKYSESGKSSCMRKLFFRCWKQARVNPAWAQRNSWEKYWVTNRTHTHPCSSPDPLYGWDLLTAMSRQSFVLKKSCWHRLLSTTPEERTDCISYVSEGETSRDTPRESPGPALHIGRPPSPPDHLQVAEQTSVSSSVLVS